MGRKSLTKVGRERVNSWSNFKNNIAYLIVEALLALRQRNDLVKDEIGLNRLLYLCLLEVNYDFDLPLPAYDARNPPHIEDKQKAKREDSRPDMYWSLMDHEANYQDWCRTFILECKRLGEKTSESWILTEEYVKDGIMRFFLDVKGYGKGCETGAMAGYVQDMDFDTILQEVNYYLADKEQSIPVIPTPINGWQHQGVSNLQHTFNRSYNPTWFSLQHFWIDMKDCSYLPSPLKDNILAEQEKPSSDNKSKKKRKKRNKSKKLLNSQEPKIISQMELPINNAIDTNIDSVN